MHIINNTPSFLCHSFLNFFLVFGQPCQFFDKLCCHPFCQHISSYRLLLGHFALRDCHTFHLQHVRLAVLPRTWPAPALSQNRTSYAWSPPYCLCLLLFILLFLSCFLPAFFGSRAAVVEMLSHQPHGFGRVALRQCSVYRRVLLVYLRQIRLLSSESSCGPYAHSPDTTSAPAR